MPQKDNSALRKLQKQNIKLKKKNKELEILVRDIKNADVWLQTQLNKRIEDMAFAKKKVEKTSHDLERIIEGLKDPVVIIDPETKIVRINPAGGKLLGYERGELLGKLIKSIFIEEEIATFKGSRMKQLIKNSGISDYMTHCLTKTGKKIPVSFSATVMLDEKGRLENIVGVLKDIRGLYQEIEKQKSLAQAAAILAAEHKMGIEAEKVSLKLRELEHIINNSPAVVFLWRAAEGWPIEFVSDNIRQFGYRPEDFYFKRLHFASIVHPDDLERMVDEVKQYNKEKRDSFFQEYRIIAKSGNVRWLNDHTWVRRDRDGIITHYQGILLDITERKQAAAELLQAGKMAAVGTMAASVAHELRNPLGVIRMAVDNIDRRLKDRQNGIRRPISNINRKLEEAEKIIKDLLSYSKLGEPVLTEEDINVLIKEALSYAAVSCLYRHDIKVIKRFGKLPKIKLDRVQIMEVLQNIIKNAYEAMEGGGKVVLSTSYIESSGRINVSIADTGCGIAEKDIEKIGKPFFSTKSKGTGLGLALSFRIVKENHRGMIKVKSRPNEGTTFTITLPV